MPNTVLEFKWLADLSEEHEREVTRFIEDNVPAVLL
jgi:hypothetical protein